MTDDPFVLTKEDRFTEGEQRFFAPGRNYFGQLRVLVYTDRGEDTRPISVRRPDSKEIRNYEEGI